MIVQELNKEDALLLRYKERYPHVWFHPVWNDLLKDNLKWAGILNKNQECVGCFCFFEKVKWGQKMLITPPLMPHCALHVSNPAQTRPNRYAFEKEVFEAMAVFLKERKAAIMDLAFPPCFVDMQELIWAGWKVNPRYTYCLNLENAEEQLWKELSTEKRKSVLKATKDQLIIREGRDGDNVLALVEETYRRQGLLVEQSGMANLMAKMPGQHAFTMVAQRGEQLLSFAYCVFDNQTCYYLLGGHTGADMHHGAGVSCLWAAIVKAKSLGCKVFDFEGSMHPGIEKYFREFGGELQVYFELTYRSGWVNVLKPRRKK